MRKYSLVYSKAEPTKWPPVGWLRADNLPDALCEDLKSTCSEHGLIVKSTRYFNISIELQEWHCLVSGLEFVCMNHRTGSLGLFESLAVDKLTVKFKAKKLPIYRLCSSFDVEGHLVETLFVLAPHPEQRHYFFQHPRKRTF